MEIIKNSGFVPGRNCGQRAEKIRYIVIHYTGAEGTAKDNISYFNNGNRGASAHYFVGRDGEIREYCDPARWYAWHCGGSPESEHKPYFGKCTNRNSIGIEICTHFNGRAWEFTDKAIAAAAELTKFLMGKYGVFAANVIRHYDVTGKACPRVPGWGAVGGSAEWEKFKERLGGDDVVAPEPVKLYRVRKSWENEASQVGSFSFMTNATKCADEHGADYAVFDWTGKEVFRPARPAVPITEHDDFLETVGNLAAGDMARRGICAAVTVAQAILESGWGKSELAVNANNLFGMKKSLSGNTWPGSAWDGKSVYSKETKEIYASGPATVKADFRAYRTWAESVEDHSAYLAGAKSGSGLRYKGIVGESDYRKAAEIIKAGEYATAPDYVDKLCKLVEQYGLTRFNTEAAEPEKPAAGGQEAAEPGGSSKTVKEKAKEIQIYFPGYARKSSPDDRRGSGAMFSDQNGNILLYDCFLKDAEPARKIVSRINALGVKEIDAVLSHAHTDHGGGFYTVMAAGIKIKTFYCYDPESLRLAGDGSKNARSAKEDKEALEDLISVVRKQGGKVVFIGTGDKITCGEMHFSCYRKQPTRWSEYDTGEAWDYLNSGSIAIYNHETYTIFSADGPGSGKEMLDYFRDEVIRTADSPHHGNSAGKTYAREMKARGVVLVIEANNEKGGPGSCDFTEYGSGRIVEAGITVWMLDADILGTAAAKRMTWKQTGEKSISYDVPFGDKKPEPVRDYLFRVRRSWYDAGSQIGAYKNPKTAIEAAEAAGEEYEVFYDRGTPVYPDAYRTGFWRLRKAWKDTASQAGAFKYLKVAIEQADKKEGFSLYDAHGRKVYPV